MTKYLIKNLVAHKNLTVDKLISFGFTNNIPGYYYNFKVISQYKYKNGLYTRETINICFNVKDINNIILENIMFLDENSLSEDNDYKNYFEGKIDFSMLDDYYKVGVKTAEDIIKELVENKILEFKE